MWAQQKYVLCLQFANVEVAVTFLKDEFGARILHFLKREELLTLAVCIVCFILGLPHVTKVKQGTQLWRETNWGCCVAYMWGQLPNCCHFCLSLPSSQGGIYVFQLMDHYTAVVSLVFLAFCEIVAVCWIFGKNSALSWHADVLVMVKALDLKDPIQCSNKTYLIYIFTKCCVCGEKKMFTLFSNG